VRRKFVGQSTAQLGLMTFMAGGRSPLVLRFGSAIKLADNLTGKFLTTNVPASEGDFNPTEVRRHQKIDAAARL
jgi:hypothetical protein